MVLTSDCAFDKESNRVLKTFDYRGCDAAEDQRRTIDFNLEYLEGRVEGQIDDFVLISYPFVHGTHQASTVAQFLQVLEQLHCLHLRGNCHGDIRGSNIVFSNDGQSKVIDFDFAGKSGEKRYPKGYNPKIEDG